MPRASRTGSRSCAATRCGCPCATGSVGRGNCRVRHSERAGARGGVREMARALRPGGRLAILEFGVPTDPGIGAAYRWYFAHVLPRIGRLISGHTGAYSYLPASVGAFPPPAEFVTMLRKAGFDEVRAVPLTLGIVYLYTGRYGGSTRSRHEAGTAGRGGSAVGPDRCSADRKSLSRLAVIMIRLQGCVIHFDFDDRYQDELVVGSAISRREGVVWSVVVHAALVGVPLLSSKLGLFELSPEELEQQREQLLAAAAAETVRGSSSWSRASNSCSDVRASVRSSRTRIGVPRRVNGHPCLRIRCRSPAGTPPSASKRRHRPTAEGRRGRHRLRATARSPKSRSHETLPDRRPLACRGPERARRPPMPGALGDAVKNLQRYTQNHTFNNPQGGTRFHGSQIPVRLQGRRLWAVAPAIREPGQTELVRAAVGDELPRPRGAAVQHSQERTHHRRADRAALGYRLFQPRGVQRHPWIEPHRAAPAGVPGRQGAVYRHLLLQRARRAAEC